MDKPWAGKQHSYCSSLLSESSTVIEDENEDKTMHGSSLHPCAE